MEELIHLSLETQAVLAVISKFGPIRPLDLSKKLDLSVKNTYKHLKRLLDEDIIIKSGRTPKVYYSVVNKKQVIAVDNSLTDFLVEQNYIYVSQSGEVIRGISGLAAWCQKNNFDLKKEKELLAKRIQKTDNIRQNGVISARYKLLENKQKIYLDHLYYGDFYTIDHFEKTKLGQLVYLGKGSQNKEFIKETSINIKSQLLNIMERHQIKMIGFIPPTVERKTQFMTYLKRFLEINLPEIKIEKIESQVKVAQKTLLKFEDRLLNAKETLAVDPNQKILGNVLLIDDAVGSGSTLNQSAGKIRNITDKKIKIIGYSVVGSAKGFEVISEV